MSPAVNVALRGVFTLLFGAAGLWMARIAVLAARRRSEWRRDGSLAEGEIVDFQKESSTDPSDTRPLFAPIVTYRHRDGQIRRFTSGTSRRQNPFVLGQRITVRYLGAGLQGDAEIDSETASLLPVIALWTLSVVFVGCALLPILMPMPARK